ncbi:MAG: protein kinase, partial [Bacteroidales bacterium]|nr:protein kinase [Bacteroidales bacterium]
MNDNEDEELCTEVLDFLERHCEAFQTGQVSSIPQGLVEKHPELQELVDCMNMLESFAEAHVTDSLETIRVPQSGFSSSIIQQLPRDFGSFCLESELGRGGMGVVYKARHRTLDTHYALKMIRASEFASDEEVRRFYQEARAASRLRHPNIVSVHDAGEQDGLPFLVMTYIEGSTLADLFQKGRADLDSTINHL